eukprot:scaffold108206_cov36-Phaeocystis_antarctica.AAC.1
MRALGVVAGRTCAAVHGASMLVSSQLPCRVSAYSREGRPLEVPTERNLLCQVENAPRRSFGAAPPNALSFSVRACGNNRALRQSCSNEDSVAPFFTGRQCQQAAQRQAVPMLPLAECC